MRSGNIKTIAPNNTAKSNISPKATYHTYWIPRNVSNTFFELNFNLI